MRLCHHRDCRSLLFDLNVRQPDGISVAVEHLRYDGLHHFGWGLPLAIIASRRDLRDTKGMMM